MGHGPRGFRVVDEAAERKGEGEKYGKHNAKTLNKHDMNPD